MLSVKSNFLNSLFPLSNKYVFPYQQPFTKDALIGLAMSASYIPQEGEKHQMMVSNLTNLHQKYRNEKGLVYLKYNTTVYLTSL